MLGRVSLALLVAACGGSDPAPGGADAPDNGVDAAPATIMTVACGNEVESIESTGGFRFMPNNATITAGQSIEFINGPSHSIVPAGATPDNGFRVGFGATTCLMFTQPGTYQYRCNPHTSMTGTITVN
jgi:plastocyanin